MGFPPAGGAAAVAGAGADRKVRTTRLADLKVRTTTDLKVRTAIDELGYDRAAFPPRRRHS